MKITLIAIINLMIWNVSAKSSIICTYNAENDSTKPEQSITMTSQTETNLYYPLVAAVCVDKDFQSKLQWHPPCPENPEPNYIELNLNDSTEPLLFEVSKYTITTFGLPYYSVTYKYQDPQSINKISVHFNSVKGDLSNIDGIGSWVNSSGVTLYLSCYVKSSQSNL